MHLPGRVIDPLARWFVVFGQETYRIDALCVAHLEVVKSLGCYIDGLNADAGLFGQSLRANTHAVVPAEEIANNVVFPRDISDVGVHVLHFDLKAV